MIIVLSIFTALWLAKNKWTAYYTWLVKHYMKWDRLKPFDCVACLSFWLSLSLSVYCNLSWDFIVLNCIASYQAGSFLEKVWIKI